MGIVGNLHISCLCDTEHSIASALPEVGPQLLQWGMMPLVFFNLAPEIRMGKNLLETLFCRGKTAIKKETERCLPSPPDSESLQEGENPLSKKQNLVHCDLRGKSSSDVGVGF